MLPNLSTMTAGRSSSNCHVTVAARLNKLHQTRALLGFCVSVFFMRVLFLLAALLFGLPSLRLLDVMSMSRLSGSTWTR